MCLGAREKSKPLMSSPYAVAPAVGHWGFPLPRPSSAISGLPPTSLPTVPTNLRRRRKIFRPIVPMATAAEGPPEPNPPSASGKRVVVCGGGVIGACSTYFLSAAGGGGANVTLVEKSSVACAASGKAGGFLALDWCDGGPVGPLARASFLLHRSLAAALDGANSYGYRAVETLSVSVLPTDDGKRKSGSSSSTLLPAWVDGPARHPKVIGTPDTTAQVHPGLFTRRLMAAASDGGGVDTVFGEVMGVAIEGGRAIGVSVRVGGSADPVFIPADAVVLALGPWSSRNALVSSLFKVSALKAHSIVLRPRDPAAITAHALFLSYIPRKGGKPMDPEVYPRPTGEVYLCGLSRDAEVPDDPEEIRGDPESIAMLHEIARDVSTHLATEKAGGGGAAEVVAEQACFLPCTDDGMPVIGEIPRVQGCYVATGHSCWGILNGPATGKAVAELVMDGKATVADIAPFSPARFLHRAPGRRV